MPPPNQPLRNQKELLEEGAAIRSDAIRTQIDSVRTFCDLADSEIKLQEPNEACIVLTKIREAMSRIDHHLKEPGHVSSNAIDELQLRFTQAQARVREIEAALSAHK